MALPIGYCPRQADIASPHGWQLWSAAGHSVPWVSSKVSKVSFKQLGCQGASYFTLVSWPHKSWGWRWSQRVLCSLIPCRESSFDKQCLTIVLPTHIGFWGTRTAISHCSHNSTVILNLISQSLLFFCTLKHPQKENCPWKFEPPCADGADFEFCQMIVIGEDDVHSHLLISFSFKILPYQIDLILLRVETLKFSKLLCSLPPFYSSMRKENEHAP